MDFEKILDLIGSKGGQSLIAAGSAGLQAYGAGKEADANRALTREQFQQQLAQRAFENQQANDRSRSTTALAENPLGADQQFAQRNGILAAILGNARNVSYTPKDPMIAASMPTHSGGLQLPSGGLDPGMIQRLFGDNATQNSILSHSKNTMNVDPRFQATPMSSLFGTSADGSENANDTAQNAYGANALQRDEAERARQREIIQRAIDEDINGEKQKKHSKLGSVAKGAASGAALGSFVPGIGTIIGGGIGALKGLFS